MQHANHDHRRQRRCRPRGCSRPWRPAHIYIRLGDYAAAVGANLAAEKADDAYATLGRRIHNNTYEVGYAEHNLRFIVMAAGMDGDYDTGLRAARQLQAGQAGRDEANVTYLYTFMVHCGRWQDILNLAQPDRNAATANLFGGIDWRGTPRGCALAELGRPDEAEREFVNFESAPTAALHVGDLKMIAPWATINRLIAGSVRARIAAARGKWPDGTKSARNPAPRAPIAGSARTLHRA